MSDSTQYPPSEPTPPEGSSQPGPEQPTQPPPDATPPPPPPGGGFQPGAAPPPPPQQAPGVGQPADLLNRFLARLIDFILLAIVGVVIVGVVIVGLVFGASAGATFGTGGGYAAGAVSAILTSAIYLGYFAFLESSRGQTVGKMLLKLETRGPDGGRPSMEQALRRNAFVALGIIGVIPLIGGLIGWLAQLAAVITIAVTINNNTTTRRGWHDDFAGGTSVIKVG